MSRRHKIFFIFAIVGLLLITNVFATINPHTTSVLSSSASVSNAGYGMNVKVNYHQFLNNLTGFNVTVYNGADSGMPTYWAIWENNSVKVKNGTMSSICTGTKSRKVCIFTVPYTIHKTVNNYTIMVLDTSAWGLNYSTSGLPHNYPSSVVNLSRRATSNGLIGTRPTIPATSTGEVDSVFGLLITNFTTMDITPPVVKFVRPINATVYNTSNIVTISANVTNLAAVSQVWVNVTLPNSSVNKIQLKLSTGDKYNNTFIIPNKIGIYTVKFLANDTSNNKNQSVITKFIANDVAKPQVSGVRPINATVYNTSNIVTISANITDNIGISNVRVNVTYPNGTVNQLTLKFSSGFKYNNTFTIPSLAGIYIAKFLANDTSNNKNQSVITKFIANDVAKPQVSGVRPVNATVYDVNQTITISSNVTDNIAVSQVWVNVTLPNSSVVKKQLKFSSNRKYNSTYAIPSLAGIYIVKFLANDTTNNKNQSVITQFVANPLDTTKPSLSVYPSSSIYFSNHRNFTVSYNVSDNVAISNVTLFVYNSTGLFNKSIQRTVFTNFTIRNMLANRNYTWYINATDTSRNVNKSTTRTLVIDTVTPFLKFFNINSIVIDSANIAYNSSEDINTTINYGTSKSSLISKSKDATYNQYHLNTLNSLTSLTTYFFNITYCDRANNCLTNGTFNFTTTMSSGGGGSSGGTSTSTSSSPDIVINNAVLDFVSDHPSYTQQDLLDLQTDLKNGNPPIDIPLDVLKAYVDARFAVGGNGGTGGSSAPPVVYIKTDGTAYVIATVPEGSGSYVTLLSKDSTRTKQIQLYNLGSREVTIDLKCDDTTFEGATTGFCQNVKLSTAKVILPPNEKQKYYVGIEYYLPADYSQDKAFFQILTTDNQGDEGHIGFEIDAGYPILSFFTNLIDKAGNQYYTMKLSNPNYRFAGLDVSFLGNNDINIPKGVPDIIIPSILGIIVMVASGGNPAGIIAGLMMIFGGSLGSLILIP